MIIYQKYFLKARMTKPIKQITKLISKLTLNFGNEVSDKIILSTIKFKFDTLS